jgi:hypothetical protein
MMRRLSILLFITALVLASCGEKEPFPYSPAKWRTPVCFLNDWQKSLVDQNGELAYDFGPGPYAEPKTGISIGLKNEKLSRTKQTLYSAEVPIVSTRLEGTGAAVDLTAFALPDAGAVNPVSLGSRKGRIIRNKGFVGCIAWTIPEGEADPAFRNVAWGTGRPIQYGIVVRRGASKQVALGFCDGYRKKDKITRVMKLTVEGAGVQEIDLLKSGDRNQPQAFLFDGRDTNRDGVLTVDVSASNRTIDPNTLINVIWIFRKGFQIDMDALIAGRLTADAEVVVDCGAEPHLQDLPLRRDGVIAEFDGAGYTPVITIRTNRVLDYDSATGKVSTSGRPYLTAQPGPVDFRSDEKGYELEFPADTRRIDVVTYHAHHDFEEPAMPDLDAEMNAAIQHWEKDVDLPVKSIVVPDARIQALVSSAMRVLMQISDLVDGYPQFQPGPSVYRGFWASDGMWDADAALLLGDYRMADLTVKRYVEHQNSNGRIQIMSPSLLHRETSHYIWLVNRYASLTQDMEWLERNFEPMAKAVDHIKELRGMASADSTEPYYRLIPPGLTDGGIGGVNAEFGGVYWSLIGLKSAAESAEMLGRTEIAKDWWREFEDLKSVFLRAAERDMQVDSNGNRFLPMKMMQTGEIKYPQRGQAQLCQTVFPGKIFGLDQPFIKGLFDIYDDNMKQGLVLDTGWLKQGVWPFHAAHRALSELWLGRTEKAWNALFAYADHSAPTYLWVEEQHPKDVGTRVAGDRPQTNANAQFIRLMRHLLVLERGDDLYMLFGVPEKWIHPSAKLQLNEVPTMFGELMMRLHVSDDETSASLNAYLNPKPNVAGNYVISLKTLKARGYRLEGVSETPDVIRIPFAESVKLNFVKD